MIVAIIPSHNQSKNILPIILGYERQTIKPNVVLFVLDRCVDDSKEVIESYNSSLDIRYIEKEQGNNFSAGMTRDYGVDYVEQNIDYEMIVFTDGDCIPSKHLIEEHLENIRKTKKAIVSCGRRACQNINGKWIDDERNIGQWVNGFGFNKNGRIVLSSKLAIESVLTYSCNFAFNKKAIELCKNINETLSNSNRVFNPDFDGSWGGEDNFISHCLYLTNNWIVLTSNKCLVYHIYHEEQPKDLDYKNKIVDTLSKRLKEKIINGDIEGKIDTFSKNTSLNISNYTITSCIKYYSSSLPSINIKHDYDKDTFDCLFNLIYSRLYVFEEDDNKRIVEKNVVEIVELLNYMKFYLKDDTIEFEDDIESFISKNKPYTSTYSK